MFTQLFTILPLTCALFVLLFGVYIISRDTKSRMNQLMFAFCMSMLVWMFGTFMMFGLRHSDVLQSVFWDRFVYAGVVFMPSLMHHFSLLFTGRKNQLGLLKINYLLSFIFLILSRTAYFVDGLYVYSWGAHSKAQMLHHLFLVYFFLGTGLFFYNLWSRYKKLSDRQLRIQTVYVFISFAIVIFIGGSAYLYAYGLDTKFPFAYFAGLIFPVMLFYAVTRHHLFGKKVVGTEVLVGMANFILVTEIFLSKTPLEIAIRVIFSVVIGVIGVLLIQSVRKEVERREEIAMLADSLEKANVRLQELDRQKTEFLSIASHQLRTPLSILKGYIELIGDGAYGKVSKKLHEILNNMDESNERLVRLVNEFLNITRLEQDRTKYLFEMTNIGDMVGSVAKELELRAKDKGLKISWKEPKSAMSLVMDEEKVRQVVFNYIDNAIKYCDAGTIAVHVRAEDGGYAVRVQDGGFGFEKQDEVNFFQKFYRGENVKGTNVNGTGLGLYVCRKFIEAHGGKVWAHSQGLKKGSEFGFWLPKAPPSKVLALAAEPAQSADAPARQPEQAEAVKLAT